MQLAYGGLSVILPSPTFTNTESLNIARVTNETKRKKLSVFRDALWPSTRMMTWRFDELPKATYDALIVFLKATLGQEITVTDYLGRTLIGVITNPGTEATEHYGYSIELDFEGDIT